MHEYRIARDAARRSLLLRNMKAGAGETLLEAPGFAAPVTDWAPVDLVDLALPMCPESLEGFTEFLEAEDMSRDSHRRSQSVAQRHNAREVLPNAVEMIDLHHAFVRLAIGRVEAILILIESCFDQSKDNRFPE